MGSQGTENFCPFSPALAPAPGKQGGILAHSGTFWCPCDLPLHLEPLNLLPQARGLEILQQPTTLPGEHRLGEAGTPALWELPFSTFPQGAVKICPPLPFPLWRLLLLSEPREDSCESQSFSAGGALREPRKVSKGVQACSCRSEGLRVRQTPPSALSLTRSLSSCSQTWKPWMGF